MDLQASPPPRLIEIEVPEGKEARMTGAIPEGWRDDSAWADVRGEYIPEEFEGTRYLRVRVDRIDRGIPQLASLFPGAEQGKAYEIRIAVRAQRPVNLTVAIRQDGPPYREYWKEELRVTSPQFEEVVLQTTTLPPMTNPLFMLQFAQPGTLDIRGVSIVPFVPEEGQKGEQNNLLRMSRFPLGPQTGMSLYREVSDDTCVFDADPTVWGPSGTPALRISTGENPKFHFDGELIRGIQRDQPHTASVWIKGNGTLIMSAMSARDNNITTEKERFFRIRPEHGWQRAILSFTSAKDTPSQFLRCQVKGDIWMDAFMVASGDEAPPFAGQGQAEVALSLSPGEASLAGIQFAEEPPTLQWAASGQLPGSTLRTKITTASGSSAELDPIPLTGKFYQTGELNFGVIANEPLGAFRINSAVFDSAGQQISPWSERTVLRVEKPRFWGRMAPESAFGQHIRPAKRHILMAKALGNNWARLHNDGAHITDWASLEPKPGEWRWKDDHLQRYLDGHLSVLGQFSTAPKWASYLQDTGIDGDGGYFGKYFLPKDLNQFADYVTKLATRYQGKITAYEVWNEPWQVRWFGVKYVEEDGRRKIVAPPDAAKRYVDLSRTAYEAAKKVDPGITIVGLNSTSTEESRPGPDGIVDGKTWSADFIKAGGLEWCDVVSYHTYNADPHGFPGDAIERGVHTAVGPNDRFPRIKKPVWMSEGSSTVGGRIRFGLYQYLLPFRNPEDHTALAESVLRYDLSLLANGVEKIFLYTMGDIQQGAAGTYRSMVTLDGSAHPSALGRTTLAWHVDGLKFLRHEELVSGLHAYYFEGEGRSVAVLAPRPNHAPFKLPETGDLQVRDIWNNPLPPGAEVAASTIFVSHSGPADTLQQKLQ